MKNKIPFLALIILVLGVFASVGFFHANKMSAYAQGAELAILAEENVSGYLLDTSTGEALPVKMEEQAGITSGYGKFELNKNNVKLTTNANPGFKLVGWNVTYSTIENDLTSEVTIFLHNQENALLTTHTIETESFLNQPVVLTMEYADTDADGYLDQGSFNISNIFSNMTVDAVFDYIYYNVEIGSGLDLLDIKNFNSITQNDLTIFYQTSALGEDGLLAYNNAFLKTEDKVYFCNTIYAEGRNFYTLHLTNGAKQKIDLSRGAFRLGQNLEFNLLVALDVDVDVTNVELVEDDNSSILLEDSTPNSATINKEKNAYDENRTNRTTSIDINLTIANTAGKLQTLNLQYHNLFVATINVSVDGKAFDSNEYYIQQSINAILESLTLNYFHSKISSNQFFVKNFNDNVNNQVFELFCNPKIYGENVNYLYYEFNSMSLSGNVGNYSIDDNRLRYANIVDDFEIDIAYSSALYEIEFKPYLKIDENNLIEIANSNFLVNSSIANLTRGTSTTCNFEDAVKNVGYNFCGYSLTENLEDLTQNLNVTIDETAPQNLTVLAVYEYASYAFNFSNFDAINLKNGEATIYPIKNLIVSLNNFAICNFTSENLRAEKEKTLSVGNFKIDDVLTFRVELNEGFNNLNFYFLDFESSKVFETDNSLECEVKIDENFISTLFEEENRYSNQTINLLVEETFASYNFSYYIVPTYDTLLDKEIVMADIDLKTDTNSNATIEKVYFEDDVVQQINVSNLKLYEQVTITSKSRTYGIYSYQFVHFTADNKSQLMATEDGGVYSHTATIYKDNISIKVVYVAQSSTLTVVTNTPNAFDTNLFSNFLIVRQFDEEIEIDGNNQLELFAGEFSVEFKREFNFGYALTSYQFFNKEELVKQVDATNFAYPYLATDFVVVGNDQQFILQINFEIISFKVSVYQFGEVFLKEGETEILNNKLYEDFNGEAYAILTVENSVLQLTLPEGVFVNKFYFVLNNQLFEAPQFAQKSENLSTFVCNFSADDLKNYFVPYGVKNNLEYQVAVRLDYELFKFNIKVNYQFLISKGQFYDNQIEYPNLNLSYNLNGETYSTILNGSKEVVFENLPYGVSAKISLTSALPVGYISMFNWNYSTPNSSFKTGKENSLSYITLTKLVADENLIYTIEYQAFNVQVKVDGEPIMGVPTVSKKTVELFDALQITMNANKNAGYKFSYMYYFVNYTLGADAWQENIDYLYTFQNGSFVKCNEEFNPNLKYYLIKEYAQSNVFVDESIDFKNYAIVNNSIYFFVVYDYIQIKISNVSENLFIPGEYENTLEMLGILPEAYAQYFVYKYVDGTWQQIQAEDSVTVADSIKVFVKLGSVTLNAIKEGEAQTFNLANGLNLAEISYGLVSKLDEEFDYVLQFNVNSLVEFVDEQDCLTLVYKYALQNKNVNVTTNVEDEEFYYSGTTNKFLMSYRALEPFGGVGSSNLSKNLNVSMQFLATAEFSYQFSSADRDYFKITSINFYNNGVKIDKENYSKFGIELTNSGEIISFSVRFINNLSVVYNVEPIINFYNTSSYFDNVSTPVLPNENGDILLTLNFVCDEAGNGKEQLLTMGTSNKFNIASAQIILNGLTVQYFEVNPQNNTIGALAVVPKNVGMYYVKLSFASADGSYKWLSNLTLSYNVYLQILPMEITITYDNNFSFSKAYDGKTDLNFSFVSNHLIVTDNYGLNLLNLRYSNTKIRFERLPICTITKTVEGSEQAWANAQNGLNLTIVFGSLMQNDFNNNFVLVMPNNLVITNKISIVAKELTIVGLQVYDKVFDGTNVVDFDISNWSFGENLIDADYGLVNVDFSKLMLNFESFTVGTNKRIRVNSANALVDADATNPRAQNYRLVINDFYRTIYPYSISANVDGVGQFELVNSRGVINPSDSEKSYRNFINLIPIGAKLNVGIVYSNSNEYRELYPTISNYITRTSVFYVGYSFDISVGELHNKINNNLFIRLPKTSRLAQILWQTNETCGQLNYSVDSGAVEVDLSQIPSTVQNFLIIQSKQFFTWWQICLIILLILLLLLIIILIFVHQRRVKKQKDLYNEKI